MKKYFIFLLAFIPCLSFAAYYKVTKNGVNTYYNYEVNLAKGDSRFQAIDLPASYIQEVDDNQKGLTSFLNKLFIGGSLRFVPVTAGYLYEYSSASKTTSHTSITTNWSQTVPFNGSFQLMNYLTSVSSGDLASTPAQVIIPFLDHVESWQVLQVHFTHFTSGATANTKHEADLAITHSTSGQTMVLHIVYQADGTLISIDSLGSEEAGIQMVGNTPIQITTGAGALHVSQIDPLDEQQTILFKNLLSDF